jgi:hypothetical protein
MGKISTYAVDSTPSLSDKLIGTEVGNLNATKNYTIGQILSLSYSSGYGSFYDTTNQDAIAVNTEYAIKLNSTDSSATDGISIVNDSFGNPTKITTSISGVYNIAFSAQLARPSGGGSQTVDFWLKKNSVNVPWSNTSVTLTANPGLLVAAWNFFIQLDAGEYAQLMWSTTSTIVNIQAALGVSPQPNIPSVILTVNRVG